MLRRSPFTLSARRFSALLIVPVAVLFMVAVTTPTPALAWTKISDDTHKSVCRAVWSGSYSSWIKQLDPRDTARTSLAQTAVLCDGHAPVLTVELGSRACGGSTPIPTYKPKPWWQPWWVKAEFTGWACP